MRKNSGDADHDNTAEGSERIDKWLWAARFFKTRSLAAEAVDSGKAELNGAKVKRSRTIVPGDIIAIRKGPYVTTVKVLALEARRGPASMAATMYEETGESKTARENIRVQLSSLPMRDAGQGRPTKRERRQLRDLRDRD